jgi:DTW domain-containing protein YfiP/GNAT superfamily N-acetyltransferase
MGVCWRLFLAAVGVLLLQTTRTARALAPHRRTKIAHSVAASERRALERASTPRSLCGTCQRPALLCVCGVAPAVGLTTRTQVLILQHPNERRKKNFSTVPLVKLVLPDVTVQNGYAFGVEDLPPSVQTTLAHGQKPLLLYPSETATPLEDYTSPPTGHDASSEERATDTSGPVLILLDGTWTEAKRMARESPTLVHACQAVQLPNRSSLQQTSIYDAVRKEPAAHCRSTLEAVSQALECLEGASDVQSHLQNILQSHVDSHLVNARLYESRSAGKARQKLFQKNKRRREIEKVLFQNPCHSVQNHPATATPTKPVHPTHIPHSINATLMLKDGAILRPLVQSDAPLVDAWWEQSTPHRSQALVERRIALASCLSFGIVQPQQGLVACIVQYEGGALGMLHVHDSCRRRGYGAALVAHASAILAQRQEPAFCYIVDGNEASEALFRKAGWVREDPTLKGGTGKRRAKRKWVRAYH